MATKSTMTDQPIKLVLGDKTIKAERLSSLRIIEVCEDYLLTEMERKTMRTAKLLTPDEATKFIIKAAGEMPQHRELEKQALGLLTGKEMPNKLAHALMYTAVAGLNPNMGETAVANMVDDAPTDDMITAFLAVQGKVVAPADKTSQGSQKSITGRRKKQ